MLQKNTKHKTKKTLVSILTVLISFTMVFVTIPAAAMANTGDTGTDGDYGWTELGDGTVAVTSYTGAGGNITIPDTLSGKTVTQIGDTVFRGIYSLTGISLPAHITSIGDGAFSSCSWLQNVTLDANLQSIGASAFYNCTQLASIRVPDSVTTIGVGAFLNCQGLQSVTLPSNPAFKAISEKLFFECLSLTSITIPDSVTSIDDQAFSSSGLTAITIPASVSSIGTGAFNGSPLTSIQADPANTHFVSDGGVLYTAGKTTLVAYPRFATASSLTVPGSVTGIAALAFSGAYYLKNITFPDRLQTIGDYAFASSGITGITFPKSVTSIGNMAFMGCTLLKKAVFYNKNTSFGANSFAFTGLAGDGIYGIPGSTAQTYATGNSIPFHALNDVSFQSAGGTAVDDVYTESGNTISSPADPTKSGYTFGGWYKDSGLGEKWDFSTDTVTTDTTLYAAWTSASPTPTPSATPAPSASPSASVGGSGGSTSVSADVTQLYTGGRTILTPATPGGTWTYDKSMVSLKQNADGTVTVTALKSGTVTLHYTVGWASADIALTIGNRVMPQTGQDFMPVYILLIMAGCAGAAVIYSKKKAAKNKK